MTVGRLQTSSKHADLSQFSSWNSICSFSSSCDFLSALFPRLPFPPDSSAEWREKKGICLCVFYIWYKRKVCFFVSDMTPSMYMSYLTKSSLRQPLVCSQAIWTLNFLSAGLLAIFLSSSLLTELASCYCQITLPFSSLSPLPTSLFHNFF